MPKSILPPQLPKKYARALKIAVSVPTYSWRIDKDGYSAWLKTQLEEAGCLFVKIGQWISTRTDIFPAAITKAFESLQAGVSPMALDDARRVLRSEGLDIDVFDAFEELPISSGSIAQVHRGSYRGKDVAIKIQRPDLDAELREDLDVMKMLLTPLRFNNKKSYDDAIKSLDDLGTTIMRETDFRAEAAIMDLFADFFDPDAVKIPRAVVVTPKVLVMDYVPSEPLSSVSEPNRRNVCRALIGVFLEQFFELGYVHTDLHAGNLGMRYDGGALVMYDFGSAMRCPSSMRTCFKHLFVSYLNRDPDIMLEYMIEYGVLRTRAPLTPPQQASLREFLVNVLEYVENTDIRAFQNALKSIPMPDSMPDVEFRPEVFMVFRSFTLLEGLCKDIDPDFTIVDYVAPFATKMMEDPDVYRMKMEDDLRTIAKIFMSDE